MEIFDDTYIRLAGDRDSEDMVLIPSYQHYMDTIDTIDTMIFGNRLSGAPPQHLLGDDSSYVTFSTPAGSGQ